MLKITAFFSATKDREEHKDFYYSFVAKYCFLFSAMNYANKTKDIFLLTRGRKDAEKRDRDTTDY